MSDPLAEVRPGDAFRLGARAWNQVAEAARAYRSGALARGGGGGDAGTREPATLDVTVRNDTGAALPEFAAVAVAGTPPVDPAALPLEFRAAPVFAVGAPTPGGPVLVLAEPIPAGEFGRTTVSGVTPVRITGELGPRPWTAGPAAGVTARLTAGGTGATVLWAADGTGERWAAVLLSGGPGLGPCDGPFLVPAYTVGGDASVGLGWTYRPPNADCPHHYCVNFADGQPGHCVAVADEDDAPEVGEPLVAGGPVVREVFGPYETAAACATGCGVHSGPISPSPPCTPCPPVTVLGYGDTGGGAGGCSEITNTNQLAPGATLYSTLAECSIHYVRPAIVCPPCPPANPPGPPPPPPGPPPVPPPPPPSYSGYYCLQDTATGHDCVYQSGRPTPGHATLAQCQAAGCGGGTSPPPVPPPPSGAGYYCVRHPTTPPSAGCAYVGAPGPGTPPLGGPYVTAADCASACAAAAQQQGLQLQGQQQQQQAMASAFGATAAAAPPPCRHRSEDAVGGATLSRLGLSTLREWRTCERPGFEREGREVAECSTCGVPAERRCGSPERCPGYEPAG